MKNYDEATVLNMIKATIGRKLFDLRLEIDSLHQKITTLEAKSAAGCWLL